MSRRPWVIWLGGSLALLGAGCSKGGSSGASLTVSARSGATVPTVGRSLDLGDGVLVDEIRLSVVKVALESGQDGGDSTDGSSPAPAAKHAADQGGGGDGGGGGGGSGMDGESDEARVGPCLIDLTGSSLGASTSVTPVCAGDIPAGTFEELEVDFGPVAPAAAGDVAGLAAMNGSSVIVDGTIGGTAFSFQSSLDVRQKTEGAITVGPSSNITVLIDPSGWFTAPGGGVLDPTAMGDKPAIEANIRASIRSFEDDNRDGQEDGDHGSGGKPGAGM
jgi:hypothetical protein